jgi:hypothetical protein
MSRQAADVHDISRALRYTVPGILHIPRLETFLDFLSIGDKEAEWMDGICKKYVSCFGFHVLFEIRSKRRRGGSLKTFVSCMLPDLEP